MSDNIMKQIKIGKVVVNISVGQSGQPLANAMQILTDITGQAPSQRSAKMTIRQWGIRKGEPMACAVTLRGKKADAFLQKAFTAVRHKINPRSFDKNGNFAFGIREH
ncbi:50S ribosomal protein L5, partial [Candidatus Bathyarchaeota archaeon]|nr:50S ribosomal protein L5 [Candidatus Bathyarchaeota archaeon]